MSSTRTAKPGTPFRQERFSSSPEYERGLMANLVARRCSGPERAEDLQLIYFLQQRSHEEGGLAAVAAALLARFPESIGTPAMHRLGCQPGQLYDADQVREVRDELPESLQSEFLTQGEWWNYLDACADFWMPPAKLDPDVDYMHTADEMREAVKQPTHIAAELFLEECQSAARRELESALRNLCLDPAIRLDGSPGTFAPWYFPGLLSSLRQYQAEWITQHQQGVVVTEIGRQVGEVLDYALATRCLALLEGETRTGKSFAARAWCARHPGQVVYVELESNSDNVSFYRTLAKGLGISSNVNAKAQDLRERIEDTLQQGDLAIVFDEAHYLWPDSVSRGTVPKRVNWIMTALVNRGVPVGLIATPQFLHILGAVELKAGWNSAQFTGRIGHYQLLPDRLDKEDLAQVARSLLPEGNDRDIEILVNHAQASSKYLAAIEAVVKRSRYLVAQAGRREVATADIKDAICDNVIPSDSALVSALAEAAKLAESAKGNRKRPLTAVESPVNAPLELGPSRLANTPVSGPDSIEYFSGGQRAIPPAQTRELALA